MVRNGLWVACSSEPDRGITATTATGISDPAMVTTDADMATTVAGTTDLVRMLITDVERMALTAAMHTAQLVVASTVADAGKRPAFWS